MAQFSFYAAPEDVDGMLQSLSERGDLSFIPDRSYPAAKYISLKGVRSGTERRLSQNRRWFIVGAFTEQPVYVAKISENHFSVWPEYDGPILSLTVPPLRRSKNGVLELMPGDIVHPRVYWDHAITTSRGVPEDLKAAYADIVKTIKLHLVRRKIDKNLWIGRHAAKLLDGDKAIILSNGKWWNGKGGLLKSNVC